MVSDLRTELKAPAGNVAAQGHSRRRARHCAAEIDLSGEFALEPPAARPSAPKSPTCCRAEIEIDAGPRSPFVAAAAEQGNPGRLATRRDGKVPARPSARVEFVGACRNYASELGGQRRTVRSYSELQHTWKAEPRSCSTPSASRAIRPAVPPIADGCGDSLLAGRYSVPITRATSAKAAEIAVRDNWPATMSGSRPARRAGLRREPPRAQCAIAAPVLPLPPQ